MRMTIAYKSSNCNKKTRQNYGNVVDPLNPVSAPLKRQ